TLWLVGSFFLTRLITTPVRQGLTRRVTRLHPLPRHAHALSSVLRATAFCGCLVGAAKPAQGAPQATAAGTEAPSLTGSWNASALKEVWSIADWPEPCGEKPKASGAPGGPTQVVEQGGELSFSGPSPY